MLNEFKYGNYPEALALFRKAHNLKPSARTFRGMGLTAFEARQYVIAAEYLKKALIDKRKPLTDKMRQQVESVLKRSEAFLAHLELSVAPENAIISLNGDTIAHQTGEPLRLDPGTYELVVSSSGYNTEQRHIELDPGAHQSLSVHLAKPEQQAPIAAEASSALIESDESVAIVAESLETPLAIKVLTVGGLSTAAIGVTVGAITGTQVLSNVNDFEKSCPDGECPVSEKEKLSDSRDLATLSTISFVTAGIGLAAGVTGLVLWILNGEDRPDDETTFSQAWVSGQYGGVRLKF